MGLTENKRGYISCGSVQVERTSTWLFKENKGGYIPCGSLLVKDFTRLLEISRTGGCLGTGCRHGLLPNQYKSCVCLLLLYISSPHHNFVGCFAKRESVRISTSTLPRQTSLQPKQTLTTYHLQSRTSSPNLHPFFSHHCHYLHRDPQITISTSSHTLNQ